MSEPLSPVQRILRGRVPPNGNLKRERPKRASGPEQHGFPESIPASALRRIDHKSESLLSGYLYRDAITLLSAVCKAGKTTWLAHLLRALHDAEDFCGRPVRSAGVLYVTEESQSLWADRRDRLELKDNVRFIVRPFLGKPDTPRWVAFITYIAEELQRTPAGLVVFDTIGNLWPVTDENDAAKVTAALMPLRMISEGRSLLLVHHLGKLSASGEGAASRGSSALPGFVDIMIELRRLSPDSREDRRRVLSGWGRYDDIPAELVVELTDAGYIARGDRQAAVSHDVAATVRALLPADPPGWTSDDLAENWPTDKRPRKQALLDVLRTGAEHGLWVKDGAGRKGDPFTFWGPK
jgi:hypothetical protein